MLNRSRACVVLASALAGLGLLASGVRGQSAPPVTPPTMPQPPRALPPRIIQPMPPLPSRATRPAVPAPRAPVTAASPASVSPPPSSQPIEHSRTHTTGIHTGTSYGVRFGSGGYSSRHGSLIWVLPDQCLDPGSIYYPYAPYWWIEPRQAPLVEQSRRVSDAPAPVNASQPEPQPRDPGVEALRAGDFAMALAVYTRLDEQQRALERHAEIAPPSDRTAARLMGLCQAGLRQWEEAAKTFEIAESEDKTLEGRPLPGREIFGQTSTLRRLVVGAVNHANRAQTSGAWRAVAVLMEAEGRLDHARKMRGRARELATKSIPDAGATAPTDAPTTAPRPHGPASFTMPPPSSAQP